MWSSCDSHIGHGLTPVINDFDQVSETDKKDLAEQSLTCEDHFLPKDVSTDGIAGDAGPIVSPHLDKSLSTVSPWGAESSEEEGPWAPGEDEDDEQQVNKDGRRIATSTHCTKPKHPLLVSPLSGPPRPPGRPITSRNQLSVGMLCNETPSTVTETI